MRIAEIYEQAGVVHTPDCTVCDMDKPYVRHFKARGSLHNHKLGLIAFAVFGGLVGALLGLWVALTLWVH